MGRIPARSLNGARLCTRPEFSDLPAEDLEQVVEHSLSELPADAAEDVLHSLAALGKKAGRAVRSAAPAMAQGAAAGAAVGGPWGALLGAGAGLASASAQTRATAGPSAIPPAAPRPSATGAGAPPAAIALPTGQGAVATLLSILKNPTVQRALLSQVLGASGEQQVATPSGPSVPRAAINSLLAQLLASATEALPEAEAISDQDYLLGESGEYLVDPASPEQQAALVLSYLQSSSDSYQAAHDELGGTAEWIDALTEAGPWLDDARLESAEFY